MKYYYSTKANGRIMMWWKCRMELWFRTTRWQGEWG
ncbi:unnamed protein product [Musa hybrid cultivar]